MKIADLIDRDVEFFRAHIEPGILSMPKNALHFTDKDVDLMQLCEVGVYVRTHAGVNNGTKTPPREFIVPFSNCQTVRLMAPETFEAMVAEKIRINPKAAARFAKVEESLGDPDVTAMAPKPAKAKGGLPKPQ